MFQFNSFFPPDVVAFTSDSSIDFHIDKSFPFNEEHKKYLKAQDVSAENVVTVKQMHGNTILVAYQPFSHEVLQEADGLVTSLKNVPLAVRTADCLPLFIHDPQQSVIGLVHAGWKGLYAGIVPAVIQTLQDQFGVNPADLTVLIGPSICSEHYEVGPDFRKYFSKDIIEREGPLRLGLSAVAKREFEVNGLNPKNIQDSGICTVEQETCFSFRREGDSSGRMISVMMLRAT